MKVFDWLTLQPRECAIAAGEIMERDFVSAHPDEELDNVLHRILEYAVDDIPVIDDKKQIIGVISLTDIYVHHSTTDSDSTDLPIPRKVALNHAEIDDR